MCMPGGAKVCNLLPGGYVQLSYFGFLDSYVIKNLYAMASNLVLFLIFVIMVTIPSHALPGRQQIDGTTFRESVLFIGTQFSILYTFMHSPA